MFLRGSDRARSTRSARTGDDDDGGPATGTTAHAALGGASLRWHYPVQVLGSTCADTLRCRGSSSQPGCPELPCVGRTNLPGPDGTVGRLLTDRTVQRLAQSRPRSMIVRTDGTSRSASRCPGAQTKTRPAPQRRVQTAGRRHGLVPRVVGTGRDRGRRQDLVQRVGEQPVLLGAQREVVPGPRRSGGRR